MVSNQYREVSTTQIFNLVDKSLFEAPERQDINFADQDSARLKGWSQDAFKSETFTSKESEGTYRYCHIEWKTLSESTTACIRQVR